MMQTQRYAALVQYYGAAYSGWQHQPFLSSTIQGHLEAALSQVANESIETVCAGRTDAGVHAVGQVVHFDSHAQRDEYAWLAGTNRYLPADIRVQGMTPIASSFHARYSATGRHYRYIICNARQPSAIWQRHCHWHPRPLAAEVMHEAVQVLLGEHDFSAFRAAECQSKSPNRYIYATSVTRRGDWVQFDIHGNAFLHHMVRNIVGSLLMVGDGRRDGAWLAEVLASRDRTKAGMTAPAFGLYFYRVDYPQEFIVPQRDETFFPL